MKNFPFVFENVGVKTLKLSARILKVMFLSNVAKLLAQIYMTLYVGQPLLLVLTRALFLLKSYFLRAHEPVILGYIRICI